MENLFLKLSADNGAQGVDRANRIIRGVKVMSLGEAKGHGVIVDDVTLNQLEHLASKKTAGVKSRFAHPDATDGIGSLVGEFRNFRRSGNSVLADLHVSDVAAKSPRGDLASYVLDLAEKHPAQFGASAHVKFKTERVSGQALPSLRILDLTAIDLVDNPATTAGLFATREEISLAAQPENAGYVTEFVMLKAHYEAHGIGVDEYIASRRIDDGLDELVPLALKLAKEPTGDVLVAAIERERGEREPNALLRNYDAVTGEYIGA